MEDKITTDEDVADLGGLACALEVLKKLKPEPDYQAFFKHLACVCRATATREYYESSVNNLHSVASNRVNMALKTLPEFYEAFDIQPGDGMYVPPEQRVKIW